MLATRDPASLYAAIKALAVDWRVEPDRFLPLLQATYEVPSTYDQAHVVDAGEAAAQLWGWNVFQDFREARPVDPNAFDPRDWVFELTGLTWRTSAGRGVELYVEVALARGTNNLRIAYGSDNAAFLIILECTPAHAFAIAMPWVILEAAPLHPFWMGPLDRLTFNGVMNAADVHTVKLTGIWHWIPGVGAI